jgi:hypothetical protein
MPSIKLVVEYQLVNDQEPTTVTVDLRDMRAWERNNNGQAFAVESPDLGRLTYVAWSAARREGKFQGQYMAFDANCISISEVSDREVDPTNLELGAG